MDMNHINNNNKLTNPNWDLDLTTINEQILHHDLTLFPSLFHHNNFQSTNDPLPDFVLDDMAPNHKTEEERRDEDEEEEELGAMKEMMFKIAAMQPVDIDPETIRKPKRRNVRISNDPQSVAARHRRERISEKMRILQRLVPGGTKMDTASMLDEAIRYVKFLKRQIRLLQQAHRGGGIAASSSVIYDYGGN